MNWRTISLGEAIHVKHGFAFESKFFGNTGDYIVLTPGNFYESGGFRPREGKDRFYMEAPPEDFILKAHDLIIAMTEQAPGLLGSSALIPTGNKYLHNQRLGLVDQIDDSVLSKEFLYLLFNTGAVRAQISGSASGTKVRHTAPERIYRVRVNIPSLEVQQAIASHILHYDSLIENNRRRIELLEQAARLLYKEWFVHFRFPGHEHVKIVDGVPEGWERTQFKDVCETVGGGTPSTKVREYWDNGDITWVTPTDVTRNKYLVLLDSETKITETGLRSSSAKMVPPNTILMTSRASIGYFAIMEKPACTNQGFINIIPNEEYLTMYLLYNLISRVDEIRAHAGGSTYPEISKGNFRELSVVFPDISLLKQFSEFAKDILSQTRVLQKQVVALKKARDLLLPRLMNGEIAI